jgi:hypothetical protein
VHICDDDLSWFLRMCLDHAQMKEGFPQAKVLET